MGSGRPMIADEAAAWLAQGAPERPGAPIIDGDGTRWVRGPEGSYIPLRRATPTTYVAGPAGSWSQAFLNAWAWVLPLVVLMALIIMGAAS